MTHYRGQPHGPLTEGDLLAIETVARSYTPGIAYDTRWFEWTVVLCKEVRQLWEEIGGLRTALVLADPDFAAALEGAEERNGRPIDWSKIKDVRELRKELGL